MGSNGDFDIVKSKTVCFTGHRPEKLPFGGSDDAYVTRVLKSTLYKAVLDSIDEGYDCFITGLARGIDLWAGEIILDLKAEGRPIKLVSAAPFKGHGANFHGAEKFSLGNILLNSDKVVYVSQNYFKGCMQRRNEFMVNNSGKLIAVVSDYKSGTGSTIRYAERRGLKMRIIDAKRMEEQLSGIDDPDGIAEYEQLVF